MNDDDEEERLIQGNGNERGGLKARPRHAGVGGGGGGEGGFLTARNE